MRKIKNEFHKSTSTFIKISQKILDLSNIVNEINKIIIDEPPITISKGRFVKKGFSKKLDEYNQNLKAVVLNSSARTAQEAAESLNTEVGSIVKSLLFKTEDGFVLCLVSGDKRCSLNKLKKIRNQKDISMANADQVKEVTSGTECGIGLKDFNEVLENDILKFFTREKNEKKP